jgi:hypothetical protein
MAVEDFFYVLQNFTGHSNALLKFKQRKPKQLSYQECHNN